MQTEEEIEKSDIEKKPKEDRDRDFSGEFKDK